MTSRIPARPESAALEVSRKVALYFTIFTAIVGGVSEVLRFTTVGGVFIVLVMIGGVLMGVLHLLHLASGRRSS